MWSETSSIKTTGVQYFWKIMEGEALESAVSKSRLMVEYCPTDEMTGDYMTKPLQGEKFFKFRAQILGEE